MSLYFKGNFMKSYFIYAVLLVLLVSGFYSVGKKIIIKYTGEKTHAKVTQIPKSCDRYNHIMVEVKGVSYEVSISKFDCKRSIYKIGQNVVLLKSKRYSELVWPDSNPEAVPLIIICVIILAIYSLKTSTKR